MILKFLKKVPAGNSFAGERYAESIKAWRGIVDF